MFLALSNTSKTNLPLNALFGSNFLEIIVLFLLSYSNKIQFPFIDPLYELIPDNLSSILNLIILLFALITLISGGSLSSRIE